MKGKLLLGLSILLLCACALPPANTVREEPITIGQIAALTGFGAEWGSAERDGVELAVAQANAAGGINGKSMRVVVSDTQSDPVQTITAYTQLRESEQLPVIIGPTFNEFTAALLPVVASDTDAFVVTPTGTFDKAPQVAANFYTTLPSLRWATEPIATYIAKRPDTRIAVVHANSQFSEYLYQHFTTQLESDNRALSADTVVAPEETDYRTIITKYKTHDISIVVLFLVTPSDSMAFMEQARALDLDATFLTVLVDPPFVQQNAERVDGLLYTWPQNGPGFAQFKTDYTAYFGREPTVPSAQTAYDAANLVIAAMRAGANTPVEFEHYFASVHEYPGALTTITFDDYHAPARQPYYLLVVKDGTAVPFNETVP